MVLLAGRPSEADSSKVQQRERLDDAYRVTNLLKHTVQARKRFNMHDSLHAGQLCSLQALQTN